MVIALNLLVHMFIPNTCTYAYTGTAWPESDNTAHPPFAKRIISIRPETDEQGFRVHIITDGKPKDYNAFRIVRPHRLVIDLPGVRCSLWKKTLLVDSLLVKKIQVHTSLKNKVRVVFDLFPIAELPYRVFPQGNELVVAFGPTSAFPAIEATREVPQEPDLSPTELADKAKSTLPTSIPEQKEAAPAPAELAPEATLPATHDAKIGLHFSSCLLRVHAEEELQRLERYGYSPFCVEEEVLGQRWFRIYIGDFEDEQEAWKLGSELKEKGIISYFKPREIDGDMRRDLLAEPPEKDRKATKGLEVNTRTGGRAYYDFGVFAYEDGDYEDAEKNLKKALEFDPDDPFYNHYLGKTYLKMERYQETENCLSKAWEVNSDIPGLKYDLAFVNYKMSNHARAGGLFKEIAKENPSNVLAHYHAGITQFKLKRYSEAPEYLIAAAEKSPTIKANGYYYAGICYLKTGDFEKAVEKFEYVRDHAESELLREYALKWLQAVDKQKKALKSYSLYLKMGYQYDDNVRLEPLDQDIYADEGDYVAVGYFSGKYNVVNRQDYKMGLGYSHYQTWHADLDQYDLVGSIFNLYGKYRLRPLTFGLSYVPSYYWVDSEDFLMRHQVKPEVMWRVKKNLATRLSYSYSRNNHFQDNDRDGHTNEVFLDAFYGIGDKRRCLFGGIGYEVNSASHPDQYYGQLKTKLGISLPLAWGLNLSSTGKYYQQQYDHLHSLYGVKRKDAKYYGAISLSHRLFYDWLTISGEFSYMNNDSNINNYEYKRKVTSLFLTGKF